MAIQFLNPVSDSVNTGSNVIRSAPYTVPAGTDVLYILIYADSSNTTVVNPDICDYAGINATLVSPIPTDAGGTGQLHWLYKIPTPPAGTANLRARYTPLSSSFAVAAVCLSVDQNYIETVSAFSYANSASPSVSIASASGDVTLYSLTVNNVATTAIAETGGQTVLSEGGSAANAMHQLSSETATGSTNSAAWTVSGGAQRWSAIAVNIREVAQQILTFTDPVIPNAAASGTQTGFANGAITANFGGLIYSGTVSGSNITGTMGGFVDGGLCPLLPATGVTGTFTQGSDIATLLRNISSPSGLQELRDGSNNPANFIGLVLDDDTYIGKSFVDAGNPLTTNDRSYVSPLYGLRIAQDGGVTLNAPDHPTDPVPSLPYTTTLWIRRGGNGRVYSHDLTISESGGVVVGAVKSSRYIGIGLGIGF